MFKLFNGFFSRARYLNLQYYLRAKKLEFDLKVFKKEIKENKIVELLRDEVNSLTDQINRIDLIIASLDRRSSADLSGSGCFARAENNQPSVEFDPQLGLSFIINNISFYFVRDRRKENAILYRLIERLGEEKLWDLIYSIVSLRNEYKYLAPWLDDEEYCLKTMFGESILSTLNSFIYKIYMKKTPLKKSHKFFYSFIFKLYCLGKSHYLSSIFNLKSINHIINIESRLKRSRSHADQSDAGFVAIKPGKSFSFWKKEPILYNLSDLVKKMYKKQVEFKFINLRHPYLNSDILIKIMALKLKNRKNRLLRILKYSINRVRLPKRNKMIEKYGDLSKKKIKVNILPWNFNKDIISQLLHDSFYYMKNYSSSIIEKTVINSLKYKFMGGVRLEGKGRLTKRLTASRSIFKIRWKGALRNKESSYRGLSTVILKGHLKDNVQYSTIKSKTRNGAFGIKGWISGK